MAKKTSPKLIGGFVVGAIVLLLAGVVAFGGGKYFATKSKAVLFFTGSSMSGLDVGSPVTFRGVKIGTVTNVVIQYDIDHQKLLIPVYVEIELSHIEVISGERSSNNIKALIDRGLRAQLVVQSLVTGQASIDFGFHPDTAIVLVGSERNMVELPTIPSDIDLLKANLTSVLQRLAALPLDQIAARTLDAVGSTDAFVQHLNAQIDSIAAGVNGVSSQASATLREAQSRVELKEGEPLQNLNDMLIDARTLVNNVNKAVDPVLANANKVAGMSLVTLQQMTATLRTAQSSISPDSDLYFQLNRTLKEIEATSNSIRWLADYVQRHPDALLLGKH